MKTVEDFVLVLGQPPAQSSREWIEETAQSWSVPLPADFVEIAGAYGDCVISDFIYFCGGGTLEDYTAQMGKLMEECRTVPVPVLPSPGGALLWGNTIEGDQLFLVPQMNGQWTVSAFVRQWGEWYESDLGFSDWLHFALTSKDTPNWLPEWNPLPHTTERD